MNSKQKMTLGLGLIALAGGLWMAPAQANDLERFLNRFGVGPMYGPYYGPNYGHRDYRYRDYSFETNSLTSRISNRLERGLADGRLTRPEYRRLRFELEAALRDRGRMDFIGFRNRLITLDNRITDEMSDAEIAGRGYRRWF